MSFHTRVESESIDQLMEEGERGTEAERGDRDNKRKRSKEGGQETVITMPPIFQKKNEKKDKEKIRDMRKLRDFIRRNVLNSAPCMTETAVPQPFP